METTDSSSSSDDVKPQTTYVEVLSQHITIAVNRAHRRMNFTVNFCHMDIDIDTTDKILLNIM